MKMSTSVIGEPQEFRRCPAIRLGIAPVALIACIFPLTAWGFQMPAFHPLGPTRPPVRSTRPPTAPARKPASGPGQPMAKLTPEARKRIAAEMKRKALPNRKAPQTSQRGR